tara:strand:- start:34 stop:1491 length:1458 start_codon:yes stop_codon:yes gene_type:complete
MHLQLRDLAEPDRTGIGVSRAAVLLDVIRKGTPIELTKGGKAVITSNVKGLDKLLEAAGEIVGKDSPAQAKLKGVFSNKKPLKAVKNGKSENIGLSAIEKTEMFGSTGGSGAGARETALAECAVAWFSAVRFNSSKDLTDMPSDSDFAAVSHLVDTDKDLDEIKEYLDGNAAWVISITKTANKLWESIKVRNGYKWHRGGKFVAMLNDHFKKINNDKDYYDHPPFANLNKWSPADIWACECSVTKDQLTAATSFQSYNAYLKEMIDKKILFGISLKKAAASSITLSKVNYTITRPTASFDSIYAKSFDSLDVWMYTKGKIQIEVQFRDTSGGSDLTWQGEAIGTAAKHGKIGGGVYSKIIHEVTGSHLYTEADFQTIKSKARGGRLTDDFVSLANKATVKEYVSGQKNPKKPANYEVPEINAELVEYHYNRTKHKGQWVFSKYMGMLMIDKMMSMTTDDRDKVSNLIAQYATSQHTLSAPFLKTS